MKNPNYSASVKKVPFGSRKSDGVMIYLTMPKWDCDWYWSFGYLGNKDEHYHLDNYQDKQIVFTDENDKFSVVTQRRNNNMHDLLLEDYDLADNIKSTLWVFCEMVLTVYALKETAEVLGRGGSHMTTNPCKNIIINTDEVTRINNVVLPSLFEALENLLGVKGG